MRPAMKWHLSLILFKKRRQTKLSEEEAAGAADDAAYASMEETIRSIRDVLEVKADVAMEVHPGMSMRLVAPAP